MAKQVITTILSDLSGTEGAETQTFSVNGVGYEIDLTKKEVTDFTKKFDRYVNAARRTTASRNGSTRRRRQGNGPSNKDIRAWARDKGIKITDRGRIAGDVVRQYEEAH